MSISHRSDTSAARARAEAARRSALQAAEPAKPAKTESKSKAPADAGGPGKLAEQLTAGDRPAVASKDSSSAALESPSTREARKDKFFASDEYVATLQQTSSHKVSATSRMKDDKSGVSFSRDAEVTRSSSNSLVYDDQGRVKGAEVQVTYSQTQKDGRVLEMTQTKTVPDPSLSKDSPEYQQQMNALYQMAGGASGQRKAQYFFDDHAGPNGMTYGSQGSGGAATAGNVLQGAFEDLNQRLGGALDDPAGYKTERRLVESSGTSGANFLIGEYSTSSSSSQVI